MRIPPPGARAFISRRRKAGSTTLADWFEPGGGAEPAKGRDAEPAKGHGVMLISAGQFIEIYSSPDLSAWSHSGSIRDVFSADATWEMPELLCFEQLDGQLAQHHPQIPM